MTTPKIITLTQPWASLVALGAKKYETRSWKTEYRGPLLIHAATSLKPVGGLTGLYDICTESPFFEALFGGDSLFSKPEDLPRGVIVASCLLEECIQSPGWMPPGCPTPEEDFGDWTEGRWAWELRRVRSTFPIRYRGAQGIRDVDPGRADSRHAEVLADLLGRLGG